jgi:ATP-binding cassette subfamily B protein
MAVAKPIIDYASSIKTKADWSKSSKALRIILSFHRPYVHYLAVIVALAVVRSYLFTLEPQYTSQILDQVVTAGHYELLLGLVTSIVLAVMGFALSNFVILYLNGRVAQYVIRDIRATYYHSLQQKSFSFYDSAAVGDLLSRATMDLQAVDMFCKTWLSTICDAIFTTTAVFVVMRSISPTMSIVAMVPMPFIFFFQVTNFVQTMPKFRKMNLILGRLGAYIQQNIIGMKNVRIFGRENEMEQGFREVESVYIDTALAAGRIQSQYTPSTEAILNMGIAFVYVLGANLIISPGTIMTIGDLTLFSRYMMRLTMPLRNLSQITGMWINASAGLERVYDAIDFPVEVKDRPDAKDLVISKGEVAFAAVSFGYNKDRPVVKNLDFQVRSGEKIAILGATGSGKTSLVYLIPRFYDVDAGSITIDGVDVRDYKLSSLRTQIGLVLQDVFLFSGTIRHNIAFGNPNASIDDITSAAKLAQIHDFIASLPEGYDSLIGERGVTLSGGQKQRITIARALLTKPKILIFDDSLCFVDAKTEQEIQQAIEEAMKGRTTFMIAQRLSTIKNADRILVLDNGVIVELGTHAELMAREGIYRKIYETQFLEKAPEMIVVGGDD